MSDAQRTQSPARPLTAAVHLSHPLRLPAVALHVHDWPGRAGHLVAFPHHLLDGRSFDALAAYLAPRWRFLAIDPRGRGLSGRPRYGYGPLVHAADTLTLLDVFGFPTPVLIGHGAGCLVALLAAGWQPERVGALVLLAPDPALWPPPSLPSPLLEAGYPDAGAARAALEARLPRAVWGELDALLQPLLGSDPDGMRWRIDPRALEEEVRAWQTAPPDVPALLPRVTCPTLVIAPAGASTVAPSAALVVAVPEADPFALLTRGAASTAAQVQAFLSERISE